MELPGSRGHLVLWECLEERCPDGSSCEVPWQLQTSRRRLVRYFTHYWRNEVVSWHEREIAENRLPNGLDHTAGNLFSGRRVGRGDLVYVVTVFGGRLRVLGRLEVDDLLGQSEAQRRAGYALWEADDHIMARPGTVRPIRFDVELDATSAAGLRFVTAQGDVAPVMEGDLLDRQTLRGLRELTRESALVLDRALGLHP